MSKFLKTIQSLPFLANSSQETRTEQDDLDWNWDGDGDSPKTITSPKNKGSQVEATTSPAEDYYSFIKQNLRLSSVNSTYQYRYEHEDQVILQWRVEACYLNLPKGQKELNIELLNFIKSNDTLGLKELLDNNKDNKDLKAVLDLKRGKSELTLLHVLCMSHNYDLAKCFLGAGADPNIQDHAGRAPLHYIADKYDLVGLLMENKADPNIQDNRKKTALHYCADDIYPNDETIACVNLLLKNGADLSAMDNDKKTPMQIASDNNFYNAECFFSSTQKELYEKLHRMIYITYEFPDWTSPPRINNQNVESLEKFLDQNKGNEDLKIVLSNKNEEGVIKVLETLPKDRAHDEDLKKALETLPKNRACDYVRKLVEDAAKAIGVVKGKREVWVIEEGDGKTTQSLFDAYLKQQGEMKLKFINGLSQVKDMTELQGYVNKYINSGIMLNFIPKQHCWKDTDKNQIYLLDSVIDRIGKLEENPQVASDIICELVLRGAVLGNRNSSELFDKALKPGGHTSLIEAYDTHLNFNRNFVEMAEGAVTGGKLNNAIIDNTTFFLEFSKDSKIDVAKVIYGARNLGLVNGYTACGKDEVKIETRIETRKDIIRIGKSEAEIETHNGKRNYTNLADGSDIVLTFHTSAGELRVRLYTNEKSKDLIKVEVMDKETLARLKDPNEIIGVACSLGGVSVNEAIKQGFFVRAGKLQMPEIMHEYKKPPEEEKTGDGKQWQNRVKQQQKQKSPEKEKEGNDKKCQSVVEQLPPQQSPEKEKEGNDKKCQSVVEQLPPQNSSDGDGKHWQNRVEHKEKQTIGNGK